MSPTPSPEELDRQARERTKENILTTPTHKEFLTDQARIEEDESMVDDAADREDHKVLPGERDEMVKRLSGNKPGDGEDDGWRKAEWAVGCPGEPEKEGTWACYGCGGFHYYHESDGRASAPGLWRWTDDAWEHLCWGKSMASQCIEKNGDDMPDDIGTGCRKGGVNSSPPEGAKAPPPPAQRIQEATEATGGLKAPPAAPRPTTRPQAEGGRLISHGQVQTIELMKAQHRQLSAEDPCRPPQQTDEPAKCPDCIEPGDVKPGAPTAANLKDENERLRAECKEAYDQAAALRGERNEFKDRAKHWEANFEAERDKARHAANNRKNLYIAGCFHCEWKSGEFTTRSDRDNALNEHQKTCENHPNRQIERLEAELAERDRPMFLVSVDGGDQVEMTRDQYGATIDTLRAIAKDGKTHTISAHNLIKDRPDEVCSCGERKIAGVCPYDMGPSRPPKGDMDPEPEPSNDPPPELDRHSMDIAEYTVMMVTPALIREIGGEAIDLDTHTDDGLPRPEPMNPHYPHCTMQEAIDLSNAAKDSWPSLKDRNPLNEARKATEAGNTLAAMGWIIDEVERLGKPWEIRAKNGDTIGRELTDVWGRIEALEAEHAKPLPPQAATMDEAIGLANGLKDAYNGAMESP